MNLVFAVLGTTMRSLVPRDDTQRVAAPTLLATRDRSPVARR
jgi:hypothetical protein